MCERPTFALIGAFRCCQQVTSGSRLTCSRHARWKYQKDDDTVPLWFCDEHRLAADELVIGRQLVRRVSVTVDVLFCGVFQDAERAELEAVTRLQDAIESAGGVVNLQHARSVVGYFTPATGPGAPQASAGKGAVAPLEALAPGTAD